MRASRLIKDCFKINAVLESCGKTLSSGFNGLLVIYSCDDDAHAVQ
jgi:hypothetical protein